MTLVVVAWVACVVVAAAHAADCVSDPTPTVLCDGADLRGRDLKNAHLPDASFAGANLEGAVLRGAFLAGATFSIADACLLPFLQRVEDEIPASATHLKGYMARAHATPAFAKTVVSSWWYWW